MKLWSLNRVIRWFGVRLWVEAWDGVGERTPTKLGLTWAGLPGSERWRRWDPNNPAPIRSALRGGR